MKITGLIGICFLFWLDGYAQNNSVIVVNLLKAYNSRNPAEKVYLHFDKPYYAAGDTLYFKAYVTMGEKHVPSLIDNILHVDLINANSTPNQSIKLLLKNGIAWGDFTLPDSLSNGDYRIRAWTRWMLNDTAALFEKIIPIGSLRKNRSAAAILSRRRNSVKPEIQFLPEGGNLVVGVRSKVAFKTIASNGLGISVNGILFDNENNEISKFTSRHLGMGSFDLLPEQGKAYHATLTYANGTTDSKDLPTVENQGVVLSVNNDSVSKAIIRIQANNPFLEANRNKKFTLLVYSGGLARTFPFDLDSTVVDFDIPKKKFFTGLTTMTLFSPSNEPLCERLIFVQNYDQLSLHAKTNKITYAPREKVTFQIAARTRADSASTGNFSVAVTNESKVRDDENYETTILTNLLLTSGLMGYVEQPNYYFNNITNITIADLDLVMLTHGYRRFAWQEVLNPTKIPPRFQPETTLSVSGTAVSLLNKPIAEGTVSLVPTTGGPILTVPTDSAGNFCFNNLLIMDTVHFILSARTGKGKDLIKLTCNGDPFVPVLQKSELPVPVDSNQIVPRYLENEEKQQDELRLAGKTNMLKEVKIRSVKERTTYASSNLAGSGHADQIMHSEDIQKFHGQLSASLEGRLIGVRFLNSPNTSGGIPYLSEYNTGPMLVVLDGVPMPLHPPTPVNIVNTNDVETVEVLRSAVSASMYGMEGGNGVIVITTKKGVGLRARDVVSTGILPVTIVGFYKAREFYTPKYEHPDDHIGYKDLRSTIYWNPEVVTDKDGNASFDFYNADGTGTYKVVIEGIDEKGNLGRQVLRYQVN